MEWHRLTLEEVCAEGTVRDVEQVEAALRRARAWGSGAGDAAIILSTLGSRRYDEIVDALNLAP